MPHFLSATGDRVELSRGDRLCIDRRRRGQTQREAAIRWFTTYHVYSAWENDQAVGPAVDVKRVLPHERALVYRRHAGTTQAQIASDLGVCVFTVRKMEKGAVPCEPLLEYWES